MLPKALVRLAAALAVCSLAAPSAAAEVFRVPRAPAHLTPVLTTMVGHLFGYYAARAINALAGPLRALRREVRHRRSRAALEGSARSQVTSRSRSSRSTTKRT